MHERSPQSTSTDASGGQRTLVIFVRYPQPGSAKTRLIPALGTHGAAVAQHRMTTRTLAAAAEVARARGVRVQLHASGDVAAVRALYPGPWSVQPQSAGDLGHRLRTAVAAAFDGGGPVVVVGSDCPQMTPSYLSAAFDALTTSDTVIGPALDGGYTLLGLRQMRADLFTDIEWSTDRVSAQTRAAATNAGLTMATLPALGDVDTPDALRLLPPVYSPQRIAVTGATGAIAVRFLDRLLHDVPSLHVTVLVRPSATRPPLFCRLLERFGRQITLLEHDLCSLEELLPDDRRRLGETDGLWHFAASTAMTGPDADVWRVNDGGTQQLLDVLSSVDAPGPLFHISTAFVSGTRSGHVSEVDPPAEAFRNSYEASKAAAERRVRGAFGDGLRGFVIRPSVVIEDEPSPAKMIDVVAAAVVATIRGARPIVLATPLRCGAECRARRLAARRHERRRRVGRRHRRNISSNGTGAVEALVPCRRRVPTLLEVEPDGVVERTVASVAIAGPCDRAVQAVPVVRRAVRPNELRPCRARAGESAGVRPARRASSSATPHGGGMMPARTDWLSVVVPVLNEASTIEPMLRTVRAAVRPREIIVVDGGSSDDTVALAEDFGARVISGPRGRGPQMHAGALVATGDVLWFLHADTLPPADAVTQIERALAGSKTVAGNFEIVFAGDFASAKFLTAVYRYLSWIGLRYGDSGYFVRRRAYEAVGGFRPYPIFEDLDLMRRLRRRGRFVRVPSTVTTSSRRFQGRVFIWVFARWSLMQVLYWLGVSPVRLERLYRHVRLPGRAWRRRAAAAAPREGEDHAIEAR